MSNQLFTNDASAILAANLSNVATTVQVASGFGALFPSPTGSQYFIIAIEDNTGDVEYCKCTSRSTDVLTVVRGQEGSTALAFTANNARVELRNTAGTLGGMVQKSGDTMSGDLNMATHNITNAVLGSGSSVEAANEIVNTPLRGATGVSTNEIVVPTDGTTRATASGLTILCQGDVIPAFTTGMILLWYGALVSVPTGWHACDGTSGTPDLRDMFVVGAGGTYSPALGGTGGGTSYTTSGATVTGSTDGHALVETEMPSHTHQYWGPAAHSNVASGSGAGWDWGVAVGYRSSVPTIAGGVPSPNYFIQTTGGTGSPGAAVGAGAAHSHTIAGATVSSSTVTGVLPPYYGLYYIMKL